MPTAAVNAVQRDRPHPPVPYRPNSKEHAVPLIRRSRASVLCFAVVAALLAFTAFSFYRGAAPGLLPERSWGAWRHEEVAHWSAHVRVNNWTHAAEADLHMGKAEDISLRAYGKTARDTSTMGDITFTLTPDGKLTAADGHRGGS